MNRPARRPARVAIGLARLALVVGIVCGAVALLAGPSYREGLLPLGVALQTVFWATAVAAGGAIVALLASLRIGWAGRAQGLALAAAAVAVNALASGPTLYLYWQARDLPRIHDISTDTMQPPQFVAVLPLRVNAVNPVDYPPATAALQRAGYPDIAPLRLSMPPAQAFVHAERVAHRMGWAIVAVDPADLRIEATATSAMFGFKDDIVVRVSARDDGSVVDIRSLSRVGKFDFGVNAARVRGFLQSLTLDARKPAGR